ncbi:MAG: cell envelope integrity protein TolA [Bacteroidales bacterium]|nr:cell envelope integrity protein TolA [Bacteroidales bacterium]
MELKPNKDWTDAIRERYLSEVDVPDATGWETIERRMHRSVVLRRSAVAAAILLPLSALLIWSPWQKTLPSVENTVAVSETSPVPPSGEDLPDTASVDPTDFLAAENPAAQRAVIVESPILPEQPRQPLLAEDSADQPLLFQPAETPSARADSTVQETQAPADKPAVRQIQELVPEDLWAFVEPEPKQRKKMSVGISAGSGAIHRDMRFNTISAPYFAKLAYMNVDPTAMNNAVSKINTSNINYLFQGMLTKAPFISTMPNPSTPSNVHYVHDLPLTFGLQAKLSLLPWMGIESGVEYTYLHSVADSYIGTLDQRLHFIGVPLRMDARIWSNNFFEVYSGLGGKMEKCVSASLGQILCDEPRLQWSVEVAGGIQYRLWYHLSLYFQPEMLWYLTQTDLFTYRTEHPLGFALQAGLRFEL